MHIDKTASIIHTPAGLGRRLGALLYDGLILFSVLVAITALLQAIHFKLWGTALTGHEFGFRLCLFMVAWLFTSFFWYRSGQTLGMLAWRIRLVTKSGNKLTKKQALNRFIWASLFMPFGMISYLWCLIDKNHASLHDLLTKTVVVEIPKRA